MEPGLDAAAGFGALLRDWRRRRGHSQMALAHAAEVSTRHLSWLESGKAQPSRAMLLRLARHLDLPLRERNHWLVAAGYAPLFAERVLMGPEADADLAPWRGAVQTLLDAHHPAPALALDGGWNLVAANRMAQRLLAAVPEDLRQPPVNVLRVSLHPRGLAPFIVDLAGWRQHALARLRRQIAQGGPPALRALLAELAGAAGGPASAPDHDADDPAVAASPVLSLSLEWPGLGRLDFVTTVTVFGVPADISTAELAIETLLPANPETAARLRQIDAAPT
jgi:transcriptional regulator with XRE-family HTH domain